ncbi:MAG: macro domain-containing protein [Phascolarctobacterium sp.]|nr:macro domain-containing protein [Phascolarctobacterium sp.]
MKFEYGKGDVMPVKIAVVRGDITVFEADAIVNSANRSLHKGSGLCKAIYEKAGEAELSTALQGYDELAVGAAIITSGFKLKAKHIIHTVTPKYLPIKEKNPCLLAQCYVSILNLAIQHKLESMAIPCLGVGHHMWPLELAAGIALDTILWNRAKLASLQNLSIICYTDKQYEMYSQYLQKDR